MLTIQKRHQVVEGYVSMFCADGSSLKERHLRYEWFAGPRETTFVQIFGWLQPYANRKQVFRIQLSQFRVPDRTTQSSPPPVDCRLDQGVANRVIGRPSIEPRSELVCGYQWFADTMDETLSGVEHLGLSSFFLS